MFKLGIILGHAAFWGFIAAAQASLANAFTCWTLQIRGPFWLFVGILATALLAAGITKWLMRRRNLMMARELAYGLLPMIMVIILGISCASGLVMWNWIERQNDGPLIAILGGLIICGYHFTQLFEVRYMPELEQLR